MLMDLVYQRRDIMLVKVMPDLVNPGDRNIISIYNTVAI